MGKDAHATCAISFPPMNHAHRVLLAGLLLAGTNAAMLPALSERRVQKIIENNDLSALFSEVIERRTRGERVLISSGEVMP